MNVFITDSTMEYNCVDVYTTKKAPVYDNGIGLFFASNDPIATLPRTAVKKLVRGSGIRLPKEGSNKVIAANINISK
jgi:hypothetical protein